MSAKRRNPNGTFRRFANLLTLTACVLSGGIQAHAQSIRPAVFVAHNIATNLQFNNFAAVSSFIVNPDGTVTWVGNFFTNDNPQAISLSPDGRWLAVTHGTSNSVTEDLLVFRVESDASLTMRAVYATPDSPLDVEWINNDTVAALETDTGGNNRVWVYRFVDSNPMITRLTQIDSEPTGVFTAYLQRHPTGNYLYSSDSALNGSSLKVTTFEVNPDGTLTFRADTNTSSYPLDMTITHDGTKLYSAGGIGLLSGGDPHRVHGFLVGAEDGILIPMDGTPFSSPGNSPAHVAVTGNDQHLIVGHGSDATIHSFAISPEDGFLTHTGNSIDIGNQGDIGGITTAEDYLYVTKRYSSTGAPSGLLIYRINPDGSFFQIGGVVDTHGTASDAVAAWVPAPTSRGDINADGFVNELDVIAFTQVLIDLPLDPDHIGRSDLNFDSAADAKDIPIFVDYYLNPILLGACCRQDATCSVLSEIDCAAGPGNGVWLGPGTVCSECPTPGPVITEVQPNVTVFCNFDGSLVFFTISGLNFSPLANVKMTQSGQADLIPFLIDVQSSDTILAGFDLGGAATGLWGLVVTNPDNQFDEGPDLYLVEVCP